MPKNTAAQSVAASLNVSFNLEIKPHDLLAIFRRETDWTPWGDHLDVFFNELPQALLLRFIDENQLNENHLAQIYEELPSIWQGRRFKELRDEAMGSPF
jgi:hypothetical protein